MPNSIEVLIKLSLPLAVATLLFVDTASARIVENVHYDHAPVLQVAPVVQTVQAADTHEYCAPIPVTTVKPVSVSLPAKPQPLSLLEFLRARFISASATSIEPVTLESVYRSDIPTSQRCQHIEAGTHYQRVVAWDVDYIYQGKKYRSRLPQDPGSCLRLRVSITPLLEAPLPSDTLPK